MINYTETEVALKELLQNIETVPGTFPPVYTCGGFVIGYDSHGQLKILGQSKPEPEAKPSIPKRKRSTGWLGHLAPEPAPASSWLIRWANRNGPVAKIVMVTASLWMLLISLQ